jgi:cobalamin-dependent methionine synthase I
MSAPFPAGRNYCGARLITPSLDEMTHVASEMERQPSGATRTSRRA